MDKLTVELNIVMAGAVSAGCYTGGVMTRLFEILDTIQDTGVDLPVDIRCRVVGGTSAGGVNAATTAIVQKKRFPYQANDDNPFYATWVSQVKTERILALGKEPEHTDLRAPDDPIPKLALSAVNAAHLDELGWSILNLRNSDLPDYDRNWLPDDTRFFFTATNLAGTAYEVPFRHRSHWMRTHYDWATFSRDESVQHAFHLSEDNNNSWYHLRDAALATSAFPVGLSPRALKFDIRDNQDDVQNPMLHYNDPVFFGEPLRFLGTATCIDGGVLNNEPFVVQNQYMDTDTDEDSLKISILIDPFPDTEEDAKVEDMDTNLLFPSLMKMFSAWKSTSRFKEEALSWQDRVDNPDDEQRITFAINPKRKIGQNQDAKNAIASGLWGGFFGFFDTEFRDHDFKLGYKNADGMLLKHFKLRETDVDESQQTRFRELHALCGENTASDARLIRQSHTQEGDIFILPLGIGDKAIFNQEHQTPTWPVNKAYASVTYDRWRRPFSNIVVNRPVFSDDAEIKKRQEIEQLLLKRINWFIDQSLDELKKLKQYQTLPGLVKFLGSGLIGANKLAAKKIAKTYIETKYKDTLIAMHKDQ